MATALGFALCGFGLLALTRKRDRASVLARSTSVLLALLAIAGLTASGLHAVAASAEASATPESHRFLLFGTEFDLLLSLGFLATAAAVAALTLVGRKRAGAAVAAALAFTVAIIGVSSLVGAALSLKHTDTPLFTALLTATLFPVIGLGLFHAAKVELEAAAVPPGGPLLDLNLSAATGTCLGLIALSALLLFSLTARETDDSRRLHDIERFREILQSTRASLEQTEDWAALSAASDQAPDHLSFQRNVQDVQQALRELNAFATWPAYEQLLSSAIARTEAKLAQLKAAVELRGEGRKTAAAQTIASVRISSAASEFADELSKLGAALAAEALAQVQHRAERRRNTTLVLSAAGVSIAVLLGAVHLLFLRDSVSRQRSEAALRRHNETLKSFAHTVAHDLRAPLRGIAGYATELEGQAEFAGARGRHCISQINTAAQNLERLIGDTLDYAQLDAETPHLTTIILPSLIASLLQQRAPEIRHHGTIVDTHFGIVTVTSWERGLVQLIGNLLDNAIKYSRHAHPPRLRIETAQTPLCWRLMIYDNGVGFDMKYHDRIFGLFKRLVTTEEFEGTGAGLAIVRKITDRLGGTVCAEGRPGGGATFLVELPRVASSDLA
ncbi:MAG TPA: ATP-binding protein [Opitutus sp.]|nr:ATP-binding protein [Opitutus sp.]